MSGAKKKARTTSSKGKKGVDETEKLVSGNGWTTAATQKFIECQTDEERIQHLYGMFSITENDYQYDFKSTVTIDFHLSNAVFCTEAKFDAPKLQFFCRTLHRMLEAGIKKIQEDANYDYDKLRSELFEMYHQAFSDFNANEYLFNIGEATELIQFITRSFLRPLRLILHPFYLENHQGYFLELKRVFQPIQPVPLSECDEIMPVVSEDKMFPLINIPRNTDTLDLATMKQIIKQYTDDMVNTIEKRYDNLEEQMSRLNPLASP